MTVTSMEADLIVVSNFKVPISIINTPLLLKYVLFIHHLLRLKKNQAKIQALLDPDNKVIVITPAYTARLGLKVWPTNVGAQKIDGSTLKKFRIVLTNFQVSNKFA